MTDRLKEIEVELQCGKGWLVFHDFISESSVESDIIESLVRQAGRLGALVSQNEAGEICCRVEDVGIARDSPLIRGYTTNGALPLHNDRADILILHAVRHAVHGGETQIVTADNVISALEVRFPEHLSILHSSFPCDLRKPIGSSGQGWAEIPILNKLPNFEGIWFCNEFVESCQRFVNCPDISTGQRHAIVALVDVLSDPNVVETIKLEAGQTLILNNLRALHGRTAFRQNMNTKDHDRLMLRVWVAPDWSPSLTEAYRPLFHEIKGGVIRGGFRS